MGVPLRLGASLCDGHDRRADYAGHVSGLSNDSFSFEDVPTARIDELEARYGALADDVRELRDLAIRTQVDGGQLRRARALLAEAREILAADVAPGPAGVHFNSEGRSWNWGNAVVGVRNAVAPPVRLTWTEDGRTHATVDLGIAYEGPPGCVHGGVSALLLDHLMGETASLAHTRLTVTGTLTLRYVAPVPLGPVRMEAHIAHEEGRKVTVVATIRADAPDATAAVEASGLFIMPSWSLEDGGPTGVGSLD